MSEYQYVAFRAIDRAVSKKDLAYMRRQSTRAEITPWSFENEYNFGDFHGNALEMMQRGWRLSSEPFWDGFARSAGSLPRAAGTMAETALFGGLFSADTAFWKWYSVTCR